MSSNQSYCPVFVPLMAFILGFFVTISHSSAADTHDGLALLIGCTKYDHLDPSVHLHGPSNDVELARKMLTERFHFSEDRIVVLSETSGLAHLRPTRANIEREFRNLANKAVSGQQVVILMAGHGSQQPDVNPSPDDPEPDGLDEIFLPADVSGWNGEIGTIPNCIVDDEFSKWLKAIEVRGALVTIIMDACHSGTMTRGVGERTRELPPGLLVPAEVMSKASEAANKNREKTRGGKSDLGPTKSESLCDSTGTVAIYAAQSTEVTVEKELPADSADRKPYGLLTYTMNQVLSRCDEPISYRELVRQVQAQYAGSGRSFPTPMIEGVGRDREVFGAKTWSRKSPIRLSQKGKGLIIDAGLLQGITNESVLSVRETENAKEPIGFIRVQLARTLTSEVIPCEFDGMAVNKNLKADGWCRVVFADAGELRMKVAVLGETKEFATSLRGEMEKAIKSPDSVFLLTEKPSEADWVVQVDDNQVLLAPAESLASVLEKQDLTGNVFGPRDAGAETQTWVLESLARLGRAHNLKNLAAVESTTDQNPQLPRIDFEIKRKGPSEESEPASGMDSLMFRDGEELEIVIRNPCTFAVDATLLYIDQNFEISSLFPTAGEINRLGAREVRAFATSVESGRDAIEHMVVIAVRGSGPIQDFASLSQPGIQGKTRGNESPLQSLLGKALGNGSKTRGLTRTAVPQHSVQIFSWKVLKSE